MHWRVRTTFRAPCPKARHRRTHQASSRRGGEGHSRDGNPMVRRRHRGDAQQNGAVDRPRHDVEREPRRRLPSDRGNSRVRISGQGRSLSVVAAAAKAGVSCHAIRRLIKSGILPARQVLCARTESQPNRLTAMQASANGKAVRRSTLSANPRTEPIVRPPSKFLPVRPNCD